MCSPCPLVLSITTRGIGINLCSFYSNAEYLTYSVDSSSSDDDYRVELPNIYAIYRALLALVEKRLVNVSKKTTSHYYEHMYNYYSPISLNCYTAVNIPIIFKGLLEAIDVIHYKDITYFPAMSKNIFIEGKFIPRPENIILSNLRQTVEALQASDVLDDDDSALQHRKNFYKNNPIPGAIWNKNNFKLMNADEIIPADYDLHNHSHDDMDKLLFFASILRGRNCCKYFFNNCANQKVTRKRFSSFICNEMGDLRVPDRKTGQDVNDYYRSCLPEGDIDSFYSRFMLRSEDIIEEGALFLLGEYPNNESFARPIYELRSENVNPYFYPHQRYFLYYNKFEQGMRSRNKKP